MITYPTNKLQKVLLSGKCEQRNLPTEYTQVEYLNNNGSAWLNLGMSIGSSDVLTFDFAWNKMIGNPFFGAYNKDGSFNNKSFDCTYVNNSEQFCFYINTENINCGKKHTVRSILKWNGIDTQPTLNGKKISTSLPPYENFTPDVNAYLFTRNNGGVAGNIDNITFYGFKVERNGVLIMDLVPAKRNADSIAGMYDTVSGNFLTSANTHAFTTGADVTPSPKTPMNIVCNNGVVKVNSQGQIYTDGTTETVTVTGDNLFDMSSYEEMTAFVNANTGKLVQGDVQRCAVIPCKPNTTYMITGTTSTWGSFVDKTINSIATAFVTTSDMLTTGPNDRYLIGLVRTTDGKYNYRNTLNISVYGGTATAEMLLKVGDYKDVQEVLTGEVTRNVGIKVFDGTENWTKGTSFYADINLNALESPHSCICNYYAGKSTDPFVGDSNTIQVGYSTNNYTFWNRIYITANREEYATANAFKQYLADQYASGTPVIIVYPLETPTTEQVTPQPLAGSTATVTAGSIDNLPIESSTIAELKKRYIGDKEVKRVYIGDNKVWDIQV